MEEHMNKKVSATLIAAALACSSLAFAQTSTGSGSSSGQTGTQSAQSSNSQDTSGTSGSSTYSNSGTIDDQSGMNATSASRSKTVASNGSTPSFDSLDTNHRGYLKQSDLASNRELSARFGTCDKNHDGKLSRDEYDSCASSSSPQY